MEAAQGEEDIAISEIQNIHSIRVAVICSVVRDDRELIPPKLLLTAY